MIHNDMNPSSMIVQIYIFCYYLRICSLNYLNLFQKELHLIGSSDGLYGTIACQVSYNA